MQVLKLAACKNVGFFLKLNTETCPKEEISQSSIPVQSSEWIHPENCLILSSYTKFYSHLKEFLWHQSYLLL